MFCLTFLQENFCRDHPKMSKNQITSNDYGPPLDQNKLSVKASSSKPVTMSQVVKSNPITTITGKSSNIMTQNRYTTIQPITPSDLFTKPTFETQYKEKPEAHAIIPIERDWFQIDRKIMYKNIFPKPFHYVPNDLRKTQKFYEFILVDTESIELSHTKNPTTGEISFSKIKILKVLSIQDWGQELFKSKTFTRQFNPQEYNYYDYMAAWNNALYLSPSPHSWFLWFKKGISLQVPKWFMKWFYDFGPIVDIFPKEASMGYEYFKSKTYFVPEHQLLAYVAAMGICWIMAWDYDSMKYIDNLSVQYLVRVIKVKWWNKFDYNLVSKQAIDSWVNFSTNKKTSPTTSHDKQSIIKSYQEQSQFLAQKQQIIAALTTSTSEEEMKERIQAITSSGFKEEDTASSPGNYFQDSQDPYDM